jgi:hypothetical protein
MEWVKIVAYAFDYSLQDLGTVYFKLENESNPRSTGAISADKFNDICNVLQAGPTFFETQLHVFRATPSQSTRVEPGFGILTAKDFEEAKAI